MSLQRFPLDWTLYRCFFWYKGCGEESECFPYLFVGTMLFICLQGSLECL